MASQGTASGLAHGKCISEGQRRKENQYLTNWEGLLCSEEKGEEMRNLPIH